MHRLLPLLPALAVACGRAAPPNTSVPPQAAKLAVEQQGSAAASPGVAASARGGASTSAGAPPAAAAAAPREVYSAGSVRDVSALGNFVRSHSAQMNYCYKEALARNPKLAGAVGVAITITGSGDVADVNVVRRSWSGPGTEQLEGCIRSTIRAWKFPSADAPVGTYPFSLSFTK